MNYLQERLDSLEHRISSLETRAAAARVFWLSIVAVCCVSLTLNAIRLLTWE